jgi:hypothetical protein
VTPTRGLIAVALVGLVALVITTAAMAGRPSTTGARPAGPARHTGPQGQVGQFVARCTYSHSAEEDPIVHPAHPGRSHRHDFFGAAGTNAASRAEDLAVGATTCDKRPDTAAYWQPTLYDSGAPVEPMHLYAYYRAAPGVDPARVETLPFVLELITGDPTATAPVADEAAGWVCGASTRRYDEPPTCPVSAPLHMLLTFQDCWDGVHVSSPDHRAHVTYSDLGQCPATHPVHIPQLTVAVKYPISGEGHELTLASGSVHSAHGDFLNAWDPAGLAREVENCIHRDVVCDLGSNREEEALFRYP